MFPDLVLNNCHTSVASLFDFIGWMTVLGDENVWGADQGSWGLHWAICHPDTNLVHKDV